jgi:signal transduction histidine kinase
MDTLLSAEDPAKPTTRDLAIIVHDFNNLLGVILNFSILAREKLAAAPQAGDQVQHAIRHLERVENAARGAIQLNRELSTQIPPQERPQQP